MVNVQELQPSPMLRRPRRWDYSLTAGKQLTAIYAVAAAGLYQRLYKSITFIITQKSSVQIMHQNAWGLFACKQTDNFQKQQNKPPRNSSSRCGRYFAIHQRIFNYSTADLFVNIWNFKDLPKP
jgi:hypothetical protein